MGRPSDLVQGTLDLLILRTSGTNRSMAGPSPNASGKSRTDDLKVHRARSVRPLPPRAGRGGRGSPGGDTDRPRSEFCSLTSSGRRTCNGRLRRGNGSPVRSTSLSRRRDDVANRVACTACARDCVLSSGVNGWSAKFNDELRFHLDPQASEYRKQECRRRRLYELLVPRSATCRCSGRMSARSGDGDGSINSCRTYAAATRALTRSRGFAGMSVATLALTIGATTAIFSVVWGILLRPLPVAEPERLVRIVNIAYIGGWWSCVRGTHGRCRGLPPAVDRTLTPRRATTAQRRVRHRRSADPSRQDAVLGRGFGLDDERPGAEPSAILSNALWRQRFGADPAMVGRTLLLDGVAHTVRGVMPPDFEFPSADLWVPLTVDVTNRVGLWARMAHLVGRLRPGVTLDAATTEVRALGPQFGRLFPWRMPDRHGTDVSLRTWREDRLGEVRPTLLLLLGAVVAVWLIGTVNLTNLQQVRAAARRRELALRAALGAGRGRVARQLLTESSLLGLFGGAPAWRSRMPAYQLWLHSFRRTCRARRGFASMASFSALPRSSHSALRWPRGRSRRFVRGGWATTRPWRACEEPSAARRAAVSASSSRPRSRRPSCS